MAYEAFANNYVTTLASGLTDIATTAAVAQAPSGDLVTAGRQWRLLIDSEILLVTGVSGTTLTVSRGAEGTTAANHSSGATATHILTAGALGQFRADGRMSRGVIGDIPTAGYLGRSYLGTDSDYLYYDSGSAWSSQGPVFPLTPPDDSTFSWLSQLGSSTSQGSAKAPVIFSSPTAATPSMRVKDLPGSTYDITMAFSVVWRAGGAEAGIVLTDGTKICALRMLSPTQGNNTWAGYWSNLTTFYGNPGSPVGLMFAGCPLIWFRIVEDGAHRTLYAGADGRNWVQVVQVATNDYLTPTKYGYYCQGTTTLMTVWHFTP